MSNMARQLSPSQDVSAKVTQILQTRTKVALEQFNRRAQQAYIARHGDDMPEIADWNWGQEAVAETCS